MVAAALYATGMEANEQQLAEEYGEARTILAENLVRLMGHAKKIAKNSQIDQRTRRRFAKLATGQALEELTGISDSQISRYKNGQAEASLRDIQALAQAFDLQAWEMLYPKLDPVNPPEVMSAERVKELQEILTTAAKLLPRLGNGDEGDEGESGGPDRPSHS